MRDTKKNESLYYEAVNLESIKGNASLTALVRGRATFPFGRWQGSAVLPVGLHRCSAILDSARDVAVETVAVLARLGRVYQFAALVNLPLVVALGRGRPGGHRCGHDEAGRWFNRRRLFLVVFCIREIIISKYKDQSREFERV